MINISNLNAADFVGKTVEEKAAFLNGLQNGFCNISVARGGKKAIYFNFEKSVEFSKFAFVKNVCFYIILEGGNSACMWYDWKSWYKQQHPSYANIDMLVNMLNGEKTPNSEIVLDYAIEIFTEIFWGGKKWEDVREELEEIEKQKEQEQAAKEAQAKLVLENQKQDLIQSFWFANLDLLEKAREINQNDSCILGILGKTRTQIRAFLKKKLKNESIEKIELLIDAAGLIFNAEYEKAEAAKKAAKAAKAAMYAKK